MSGTAEIHARPGCRHGTQGESYRHIEAEGQDRCQNIDPEETTTDRGPNVSGVRLAARNSQSTRAFRTEATMSPMATVDTPCAMPSNALSRRAARWCTTRPTARG